MDPVWTPVEHQTLQVKDRTRKQRHGQFDDGTTNMTTATAELYHVQSTSLITTLGGASEKCPYSRSVVISEVSLYVSQLDGTLLRA